MKNNQFSAFTLAILLLIINSARGQEHLRYVVDSSIRSVVEENIKSTMTNGLDTVTQKHAFDAMKITPTINDTTLPENFGFGKNLDALTQAYKSHDTIFIESGLVARDATSGYQIILTKNQAIVKYFSVSDDRNLKSNKTAKPGELVYVDCPSAKLTFSEDPTFKTDESLIGIVEFTTPEYWAVNNGHDTKIKEKLVGYFNSKLVDKEKIKLKLFTFLKQSR